MIPTQSLICLTNGRSGYWSQSQDSTATIEEPKSSRAHFATPASKSIYTGLHQTPEMIVSAAVQEDVDVVAMSVLSGAHMTLFPRVKSLLDEAGADHMLLTGGGIIPEDDVASSEQRGVGRLFGPGTSTLMRSPTSTSGSPRPMPTERNVVGPPERSFQTS